MVHIKQYLAFLCVVVMLLTNTSFVIAKPQGFEICYDGDTHLYTGSVYDLYVNENKITAEMEPIIFNDHALVPVREVFEECGATVQYIQESRTVLIDYYNTKIRMSINDNCAFVNNKPISIPDGVVPKLIYKPGGLTKTMVPVRFISENVGMNVEFKGDTGEIFISDDRPRPTIKPTPKPTIAPTEKPKPTVKPTEAPLEITKIKTEVLSDTQVKVTIMCSGQPNGNINYFSLKEPDRVVVDFKGMGYADGDGTIKMDADYIPSVRTGVDSERTRVVIDVDNLEDYSVSVGLRQVVIHASSYTDSEVGIDYAKPTVKPTVAPTSKPAVTQSPSATTTPKPTPKPTPRPAPVTVKKTGLVQATAEDKSKIIMLDAGHGGSDPGATRVLNGQEIYEKVLTLSVAKKVKAILESYGYTVMMTRTGDTLPTLIERPQMANNNNCAMFVSIHMNAAENPDAYGTEVYYSDENNHQRYNMISQELAENVLETMIKNMGTRDRGVRMANWAVIRRSYMPAVLIEVGFMSNENELSKLVNSGFQDKVAKGIAEGIVNSIHYINVP